MNQQAPAQTLLSPTLLGGWLWLGPVLVLGLYIGRITSELLRPGLEGAVGLTLAGVILSAWLLRRQPFANTWPWLLLLIYVIAPEPEPGAAVQAAALAALTWLLNRPALLARYRTAQDTLGSAAGPLLAIGFLTLYILTLAPGLLPADSGEFQLVASRLGVAHPPGFPLYSMLAHLVTRLPIGATLAFRVNLFSALTAAFTLLVLFRAASRLGGGRLPGLVSTLALGTATTFWAQATTANIRSLTALFAALLLDTLIGLRLKQQASDDPGSRRWIARQTVLVVLLLALGIVHHASLIFMGIIFTGYLLWNDPALLRAPGRWPSLLVAALAGLLPLTYLLWRGSSGAFGAPDDLLTPGGFLNHVLALGFRGDFFYFSKMADLAPRLRVMADVLAFQFSPLLLVSMALGLIWLLREDVRLGFLLGGSFLVHTLVTATYRAPQTVEYMLPAYLPLALGLGYLTGRLRQYRGRAGPLLQALVPAALLIASLDQGFDRLPSFSLLHRDTSARLYAEAILDGAPPGSVVLADWHWATPLWYLQQVEDARPDLTVHFVYPTAELYGETWARRIAEETATGRSVVATHFDEAAFTALPAPEPLGEAFLFRLEPRISLPDGYEKVAVTLGSSLRLLGYSLARDTVEIGQETILTVAWEAAEGAELETPITLFAHLVGPDGALYAQQDTTILPRAEGISLTRFRLIPRPGAAPGNYSIFAGAYGVEPLLDVSGATRTALAAVTVEAMSQPPFTQNPTYRTAASGPPLLRLIGYDWDHTLPNRPRLYLHWQTESGFQTEVRDLADPNALDLPDWFGPWGVQQAFRLHTGNSHYVPFGGGLTWRGERLDRRFKTARAGQTLRLDQYFAAGRPVLDDYVVSVRLVGYEADGVTWAWWDLADGVPAMGAIPTLKWIAGSAVRAPYWVTVSDTAVPGQQLGALLRLYDAFTGRPLPILDERISQETPWVPLGTVIAGPQ